MAYVSDLRRDKRGRFSYKKRKGDITLWQIIKYTVFGIIFIPARILDLKPVRYSVALFALILIFYIALGGKVSSYFMRPATLKAFISSQEITMPYKVSEVQAEEKTDDQRYEECVKSGGDPLVLKGGFVCAPKAQ